MNPSPFRPDRDSNMVPGNAFDAQPDTPNEDLLDAFTTSATFDQHYMGEDDGRGIPHTPPSRFTYPLPGPGGTLADD